MTCDQARTSFPQNHSGATRALSAKIDLCIHGNITWTLMLSSSPEGDKRGMTLGVCEPSETASCHTSRRRYVQRGQGATPRRHFSHYLQCSCVSKFISQSKNVCVCVEWQHQRIYLTSSGSMVMGEYCLEQSQSAWTTSINRLLSGICCTTNILKNTTTYKLKALKQQKQQHIKSLLMLCLSPFVHWHELSQCRFNVQLCGLEPTDLYDGLLLCKYFLYGHK